MNNPNFNYSFTTSKTTSEVFVHISNPENWWVGLFGERIEGKSAETIDIFSFTAGDGVHYSKQKLIESIKDTKIVWLVTESNLSFLKNTNEWTGTKICFDIEQENNKTKVLFSHNGLIPEIECYESCSGAWVKYLQILEKALN